MMTPADIEQKKFGKGIRGYREEEVDRFLDELTIAFQDLITEKNALEEKAAKLEEELAKHIETENDVRNALEKANSIAEGFSEGAEKSAALIVENAKAEAEKIARKSKEEHDAYLIRFGKVKERFDILKAEYTKLLEKEAERFEAIEKDLFEGITVEMVQKPEENEEGLVDVRELLAVKEEPEAAEEKEEKSEEAAEEKAEEAADEAKEEKPEEAADESKEEKPEEAAAEEKPDEASEEEKYSEKKEEDPAE